MYTKRSAKKNAHKGTKSRIIECDGLNVSIKKDCEEEKKRARINLLHLPNTFKQDRLIGRFTNNSGGFQQVIRVCNNQGVL